VTNSRSIPLASLFAALALSLSGCGDPMSDDAFGQRVYAYLMEHPEVLREVSEKLQAKETAASSGMLENDPRDFVANPKGAITVVEFFDYRCSFCIRAAGPVAELIKANPDVRFVFKELPIFGATSTSAARGALAAKDQGKDYLAIHHALMSTPGLDQAAIDRILVANGVDMSKADVTALESHLDDNHKLASAVGVNGTPTFIVGDSTIPGADMDALNTAIEIARQKIKSPSA
jgi:protein-disulfide isomerase